MYEFLQAIGLNRVNYPDGALKLYYIANVDGSPRWVWNAENPNPDFLRFYAIALFRAKLFSLIIKLLFRTKLQHWYFNQQKIYVSVDTTHALHPFTNKNFALFTGTEGPNRKLVLFSNQQFIKVALNKNTVSLIENEHATLVQLKDSKNLNIPNVISCQNGILILSDVGKNAIRTNTFTALHARALKSFYDHQPLTLLRLSSTSIFQSSLKKLETTDHLSPQQVPVFIQEKLAKLAHALKNEYLPFGLAHGDFTPWNCSVQHPVIHLYDFELSCPQMPFGFDAFHFVLQNGILVDHLPWRSIKPQLRTAFESLCIETGIHASFDTCLNAYLLINTTYYLDLYRQQMKWHTQVSWLLETWNDAISDVLTGIETPRELVIGDVFDFLHNKSYAAIKFPDIPPKSISEYTDIDLLMNQADATKLVKYLQSHSLVKKINLAKQSHCCAVLLILQDGSILALDLIWQLRRRALQWMRLSDALNHTVENPYRIHTLDQNYTQLYLSFFYGLNNSPIPPHYSHFFESGSLPDLDYKLMKKQIALLPENTGLSAFVNRINYLLDRLKRPFQKQGIIISFSGVDGVGKSTVIAHTQRVLEKKFRKRVVILRHRPSLLPILSAFILGKAQAEQQAAMTLPRQGQNKNLIISLLRFAYYYTDYSFGQFYVYLKYVLFGTVVLYDRYYFDFITDCKRSNIKLPKWLTKAGYQLLFPPHLNFFLYADAETILSRKQELDERTIIQLNQDYLSLFKELDTKAKDQYFAIENLNLQHTLHLITSKTQTLLI